MGDTEEAKNSGRFEWVDDDGAHSELVTPAESQTMRRQVMDKPGFRSCAITDLDHFPDLPAQESHAPQNPSLGGGSLGAYRSGES